MRTTSTLTKRDRKQLNIFERKVYRGILGPVYDNEKEIWRILTNKEIYAIVKKPTITETIRLHRLRWFGHVQRMEENRIPKRVLCMNLETTRPRGRPRNRWQDEVREDGSIVGGEEWQEKVCDREEWKKLLRTARNHRILHMPMEWMNVWEPFINSKVLYGAFSRKCMLYFCVIFHLYKLWLNCTVCFIWFHIIKAVGPPLWSSGQSFWLQIQRSRVRFPALPDFLSSSGSGSGSTQPREVNWGATWIKK